MSRGYQGHSNYGRAMDQSNYGQRSSEYGGPQQQAHQNFRNSNFQQTHNPYAGPNKITDVREKKEKIFEFLQTISHVFGRNHIMQPRIFLILQEYILIQQQYN